MAKSPEIVNGLDTLSQAWFGRSRSECIKQGICVTCGGDATSFDDHLARREYDISGMCQACQDDFFSKED